jgi:hypothetical protein
MGPGSWGFTLSEMEPGSPAATVGLLEDGASVVAMATIARKEVKKYDCTGQEDDEWETIDNSRWSLILLLLDIAGETVFLLSKFSSGAW